MKGDCDGNMKSGANDAISETIANCDAPLDGRKTQKSETNAVEAKNTG